MLEQYFALSGLKTDVRFLLLLLNRAPLTQRTARTASRRIDLGMDGLRHRRRLRFQIHRLLRRRSILRLHLARVAGCWIAHELQGVRFSLSRF